MILWECLAFDVEDWWWWCQFIENSSASKHLMRCFSLIIMMLPCLWEKIDVKIMLFYQLLTQEFSSVNNFVLPRGKKWIVFNQCEKSFKNVCLNYNLIFRCTLFLLCFSKSFYTNNFIWFLMWVLRFVFWVLYNVYRRWNKNIDV